MNRNTKRIIFFVGITLSLSGVGTILSSPSFFERRVLEQQNDDELVLTTEKSYRETTTEKSIFKSTTVDEIESTTVYDTKESTDLSTAATMTTSLAVKEESLPFCPEAPDAKVNIHVCVKIISNSYSRTTKIF